MVVCKAGALTAAASASAPPTAKESGPRALRLAGLGLGSRAEREWRGGAGWARSPTAGARLSCYLHALAELADLAVDHVALLLRDVRLLQHLGRLRDRLLCNEPVLSLVTHGSVRPLSCDQVPTTCTPSKNHECRHT